MLLLCLVHLSLAKMFRSFEEYLNPGDIFYPTLSWRATPTYLTSNHAGDIVNMTLYFYTQVALKKGYFVSLAIGFDTPFKTSLENDQSETEDNVLTFYNIVFPVAKTYGPFRLIIYSSEKGQIIASCVSYGGISIAPPRPTPGSLVAKFAEGASREVLKKTKLEFVVKLTESTSKDDYFELDARDGFSLDKQALLKTERNEFEIGNYAEVGENKINFNFKGLVLAKGDAIRITVDGFYNPLMDGLKSYYWNLCIYRYGTRTIKQWFNGTGPSDKLAYPSIELISWLPSNGYSQVAVGNTLYMDINIRYNISLGPLIGHDVYFKGVNTAKITYTASDETQSNFTLSNEGSCGYFSNDTDYNLLNCILGSNYFRAGIGNLNQYTFETFRGIFNILDENANLINLTILLPQADASVSIASLSTEVKNKITFSKDIGIFESFRVYFKDSEDRNTSKIGSKISSILVEFKIPITTANNDEVEITIPFNTTGYIDPENMIIPEIMVKYNNQSLPIKVDPLKKLLTISFPSELGKDSIVTIKIYPKNTAESIILPYTPSDALTKYEAMIKYTYNKNKDGQKIYQSMTPIYFIANELKLTASPFFTSTELNGLPLQLNLIFPFEFSEIGEKFVDIQITTNSDSFKNDFRSGIKSGLIYPSMGFEGKVQIIYDSSASSSTIRVNFANYTKGSNIFYIPFIGLQKSSKYEFTAYAKYKFSNLRILTLFKSATVVLTSTDSKSPTKISDKLITGMNNTIKSTVLSIDLTSSFSNPVRSFAISLPSNFQCDSFTFDQQKINFKDFNKSTYENNQYLFGLSDLTSSNSKINLIFENLIVPWYSGDFEINLYISDNSIINSFSTNTQTFARYSQNIAVSPAELTLNDTSCKALGLGPSSQLINLTFTFNLTSSITVDPENQTFFSFKMNENLQIDSGFYSISFNNLSFPGALSYVNSIKIPSNIKQINKNTIFTLSIINFTSPVASASPTLIIKNFFIIYKNYIIATSKDIDCNITKNDEKGISIIQNLSIFPNQRDIQNLGAVVYFSIRVKFSMNIPAGSNITLTGHKFDLDLNAQVNTWCSHIARVVLLTSEGYLSIINLNPIAKDAEFELRKDIAFGITDDKTITHTGYFLFNVTYKEILIINDNEKSDSRRIKYLDKLDVNFSSINITASRYNQGELEYYTFSFRLKSDTNSSWSYVIDIPGSYDTHFGNATIDFPDKEPGVYYLKSRSSLAKIKCTVDHWVVICNGFGEIQSGATIDISIQGYTPPRGRSEDFFLYIVDRDNLDVVHAIGTGNLLDPFTPIPGDNLDLISVTVVSPNDYMSDYVFDVSFDGKYVNGSVVMFSFPIQYHLERDNPDRVNCSAVYNNLLINPIGSQCSVEGKFITYKFTKDFELFGKAAFTFQQIMNPFNAWSRTTSKFPDYNTENFTLWTQKFEVYSILKVASTATTYDFKSYMNRNAGYAGYNKRIFEEILINGYNSLSFNYSLEGCPGLLSPPINISVKDDKFLAQNLTLKLSEHYNLINFDKSEYVLTFEQPFTYFRMKIPSNPSALGMFYISMEIHEYPLIPKTFRYGIPTRVPVYLSLDNAVQVIIDQQFDYLIRNGQESLPIKVDLSNHSPASNLSVEIVSCSDCTANPPILEFKEGAFYKFFTITPKIKKDSYTVTMRLSDYDKSSFSKIPDIVLSSTTTLETSKNISADLQIITDGQTSFSFRLGLSSPTVVYWVFGSARYYDSNPDVYNSTSAKKNSYDPYDKDSSSSRIMSKQADKFRIFINRLLSLNEDYEQFSLKLVENAEGLVFYGAEVLEAKNTTIGPYYIMVPGVEYVLILYDKNGNLIKSQSFVNEELHEAELLTASVQTQQDLVSMLVKASNFPKYRFKPVPKTSRQLTSSQDFYLLSSPRFGYNSGRIITELNNNKVSGLVTSNQTLKRNQDIPKEIKNQLEIYKDTILELKFSIDNPGQVCCIIEQNHDPSSLDTYDIFLGYGRDRKPAFRHQCKVLTNENMTDFKYSWNFKGVTEYQDYNLSCCICNNYPVVPQCNQTLISYELQWVRPEVSLASLVFSALWLTLI